MKKSFPLLLLATGALTVGLGAVKIAGLRPTLAKAQPQPQPQPLGKTFNLPLFQNGDFARDGQSWWFGGDDRVKASYLPVQNSSFGRALHLDLSSKLGDNPWSVMMTQPFSSSVRAGDTVALSFWARSAQNAPITVTFEERKNYTKFLQQPVTLSSGWKKYQFQAVAPATYARQDAQLNIWLGGINGAVEFAGFSASRPIFSNAPTKQPAIPTGGIAVVDPNSLVQVGGEGFGTVSKVAVQGQPFSQALHIETLKKPTNDYDFQFGTWSTSAVKKGDVLLASFYARALKGQPESGEGRLTMQFQSGAPDWDKSISQYIGVPREWKRYDVPFVARRDMDAGKAFFAFPAGYNAQIVEIGGVQLQNFGGSVAVDSLPRTSSDYPGQEENAAWRKAANERIERLRKGDVRVVVQDAQGKPVKGAKVEVKMLRHAFPFGNIVDAGFLTSQGASTLR